MHLCAGHIWQTLIDIVQVPIHVLECWYSTECWHLCGARCGRQYHSDYDRTLARTELASAH